MLAIVCLLRCVPDLLPERFRRNLRPAFTFADVLLLALLCMVLADPLCLYDLGVQLSFSAVAGIALCSPWLSKLWNDGYPSRRSKSCKAGSRPCVPPGAVSSGFSG